MNRDGELGTGTGDDAGVPVRIGSAQWTLVDAGGDLRDSRTCGVRSDGTLRCWGIGPVGDGSPDSRYAPTQVGPDADWQRVSVGGFVCGLRALGTVWCFGADEDDLVPAQIGADEDWTWVDTGLARACGIRSPGTLWCWGEGEFGRLGTGDAWREEPVATVE